MTDALRGPLGRAYATALDLSHRSGARVEIHAGQDVIDWLKEQATVPDDRWRLMPPSLWGFPIHLDESRPEALSVHAVHFIS